ncbi:O-fucosyltransferase 35, partial [Cucurbita argyrosperma subsp. sororia]
MCSPEDDTAKPRTKSRWEKAANPQVGSLWAGELKIRAAVSIAQTGHSPHFLNINFFLIDLKSPFPQTPLSKIHTGHPPLVLLNHSLSVIPSSHSYSYRRPKIIESGGVGAEIMVPQRHHNSNDGVSQRVNSPRFSGPITRRAHSFKRNNNSNDINNCTNSNTIQNNGLSSHHEIDLPVNSPRSEAFRSTVLVDGFESGLERKTG